MLMDIDDPHYWDRHNETYKIAQMRFRKEQALLAVWPVRVCVWCQEGVLPEPVSVHAATSMANPPVVTTCDCGASYDGRWVRLSEFREWGWVLERFGCEVVGSADRFDVNIDWPVWEEAGFGD